MNSPGGTESPAETAAAQHHEDGTTSGEASPRSGIASWYHEEDVRQPTNRLAIAGAILSFVPLLGLIFSVIGLSRAKSVRGAGRKASIVGIALSIVFMALYGVGTYKVVNSTAMDPACVSAESAAGSMYGKLTADTQAMNADIANPALSSDFTATGDDVENLQNDLASDIAEATHADVKAKLQALDKDLGGLTADYQELSDGNSAGLTDLQAQRSQLLADASAVDNVCDNITNG
jgi:hypothetical protein